MEPREDAALLKPTQRFVSQLRLVVDEFDIVPVTFDGAEFYELPLADEVTAVRERLSLANSHAAVWLTSTDDLVLLHVLALRGDDVDLRTVSAKRTRDVETVLALMVRELLIGGYVNATGSDLDLWQKVVARLQTDGTHAPDHGVSVSARSNPPPASSFAPPQWRLGIGARTGSGITGSSRGGTLAWGGELAVERDLGATLVAGLALSSDFRPWTSVPSGRLDSWDLAGGPYGGYRILGAERGEILAVVGASLSWTRYALELGTGPRTVVDYWNLVGSAGVEGRWQVAKDVALALRPEATFRAFLHAFSRRSDDMVVFSEASVSARLLAVLHISWR